MRFIQTVSYTTSKPDALKALADQWEQDNPSTPGMVSLKLLKDRDRENSYIILVEFESYEVAMQNSERPETDAFAKQMASLVDGGPTYGNDDVVQEMT